MTPSRSALSGLLALPGLVLAPGAALATDGAHAAQARPHPACHGQPATIVGTPGWDRLVGTQGRDVIVGLGGDDVILGLGGDDVLCGNVGADTLRGGAGDDELYGGLAHRWIDRGGVSFTPNILVGGEGDDLLDIGRDDRWVDESYDVSAGRIDYGSAAQGVQVDLRAGTATGAGTDRIVPRKYLAVHGSPYDDVLAGGPRGDQLIGADGDDVITGRSGDDYLDPEDWQSDDPPGGDDHVDGGPGTDLITSWGGADDLRGGDGPDTISAHSTEPALVRGGAGVDHLTVPVPSAPGFLVDGGPGLDTLRLTYPFGDFDPEDPAVYTLVMEDGTLSRDDEVIGGVHDIGGLIALEGRRQWVYHGTDAVDLVQGYFARGLRAWTYGGDDVVEGTPARDRLDVGEGHDEVDGGNSRDVCVGAEVRRRCEVVRP